MQTNHSKPLFLSVVFLSLFLWPSLILAAEGTTETITSTISQKTQMPALHATGAPEQDMDNIREMNIIISDRRYNIIDSTKIFIGPKDQEITMSSLPVPCKAKITYQLTGNNPNMIQIKVLKALPGASTSWHEPQPE